MQESFGDFFDSKMKNRSCMKNRFFIEYKNPKNFIIGRIETVCEGENILENFKDCY